MHFVDYDLAARPQPVPVTILTGFLGAGKTTLLNRILNGDHGLRAAVLVNDFGSINIDAELIVGVATHVISLANGCVCCTLRDDLVQTIRETIARPERPEYILLEASGVADPVGMAMTFNMPALIDGIRLDSITAVVDADQVFANPEYPGLMDIRLRQIVSADLLILNKASLAGQERVQRVKDWVDHHVNNIRVVETDYCDVPYEILLGVGRFDPTTVVTDRFPAGQGCGHADEVDEARLPAFETWSYTTGAPLSLEELRHAAGKLPGGVFRCKGIVRSMETPDRPVVLQVVGRRVDITLLSAWDGSEPGTRIVAIGAPGSIDAADLRRRFDACRAETQDGDPPSA